MTRRARQATAPLYLLLCIILGGSAQGIWANMALQLCGLAILAWTAMAQSEGGTGKLARHLILLTLIAMAWIALQLVPLPPSLWTHLGGRTLVASGYRVLGMTLPSVPASLMPYRSIETLFALIPPLALFCAVVRLKGYRTVWLLGALLAASVAGIVLGAVQVSAHGSTAFGWYPFSESTFGAATGFFANANHMGTLLVSTLPFLAAAFASQRSRDKQHNLAILLMVGAAAFFLFVGILISRSLAAYGLIPAVLIGSVALILPERSRSRRWGLASSGVLLVLAVAALTSSSIQQDGFRDRGNDSVVSRVEILRTSVRAIRDFMPVGSGLGTFRQVYHLYEDPGSVGDIYVIHAHNDYLELVLELGLPGVLLIAGFLFWWVRSTWAAWTDPAAGPYARAASIASAAILAHSAVDFPLRTTAISAVFAMCLGLLVERPNLDFRNRSDLWPTRHVVIG